jgi:hypothetical protein
VVGESLASSSPLLFSSDCKPFAHIPSPKPKMIFRMHKFVTKSIGMLPWKIDDVLIHYLSNSNTMVYKNSIHD